MTLALAALATATKVALYEPTVVPGTVTVFVTVFVTVVGGTLTVHVTVFVTVLGGGVTVSITIFVRVLSTVSVTSTGTVFVLSISWISKDVE